MPNYDFWGMCSDFHLLSVLTRSGWLFKDCAHARLSGNSVRVGWMVMVCTGIRPLPRDFWSLLMTRKMMFWLALVLVVAGPAAA
ncbi:MAG: hypothetical protein JXN59_19490, partial [Anaerolineae bacterium]|nr:hypothetical protein [Anaerolineae bacterium]